MDPAKRICLKNLPEGCTKREIADLVKNRTGIQPHSIDLGLNSEGQPRKYAHFSCDSTKNVLEVLGSGISLKGSVVYACPAKPHFTYRYATTRRKREQAEEEEEHERRKFWEAYKSSALARFEQGVPVKIKPPKSFYASRQKYAAIAAEIAEKYRKDFSEAHPSSHYKTAEVNNNDSYHPQFMRSHDDNEGAAMVSSTTAANNDLDKGKEGNTDAGKIRLAVSRNPPHRENNKMRGKSRVERVHKKMKKEDIKDSKPAAAAPVPLPPSKEERKLSSLQARLSLLASKIYKGK